MARILIVDDDPAILLTLEGVLRAADHDVVSCSDPHRVEELIDQDQLDAIILDIVMPGRTGHEVLASLRRRPETSRLPVLVLSALDEHQDRVQGLRSGADDYIVKPFDPEELLIRVSRLIESHQPVAQSFSGDLAAYPCWDLLQSLARNMRNGRLTLRVKTRPAQLEVLEGQIIHARYGGLEGKEAVLALLDVGEGSFRFQLLPRDVLESAADPMTAFDLQSTVMRYAWLRDELRQLEHLLPRANVALLTAQTTAAPLTDFASLPIELILEQVDQDGIVSIHSLERSIEAAPLSIHLAVALLLEQGRLEAEGARGTKVTRPQTTSGDPRLD